jgi:hypothetical protein
MVVAAAMLITEHDTDEPPPDHRVGAAALSIPVIAVGIAVVVIVHTRAHHGWHP